MIECEPVLIISIEWLLYTTYVNLTHYWAETFLFRNQAISWAQRWKHVLVWSINEIKTSKFWGCHQGDVKRCKKNCLLWDQLKGVERRISFTWRPFQNIFTAFHSKTDFGGRCARYQMPWITCHLLYSRGDVALPGPKVNKFLLDVYFPIWSVTH